MSRLTDLIAHAKATDPQLGVDLDREFKVLVLTVAVRLELRAPPARGWRNLPQRPIRKGDKVRVLPERGSAKHGDQRLWQVKAIRKVGGGKVADLEIVFAANPEAQSMALDDLVVIAEFRDPSIRDWCAPARCSVAETSRSTRLSTARTSTLKSLFLRTEARWTAFIDPPYNSGARDWKYNNDFVEGDDMYRHSKWLAMMERRLYAGEGVVESGGFSTYCHH